MISKILLAAFIGTSTSLAYAEEKTVESDMTPNKTQQEKKVDKLTGMTLTINGKKLPELSTKDPFSMEPTNQTISPSLSQNTAKLDTSTIPQAISSKTDDTKEKKLLQTISELEVRAASERADGTKIAIIVSASNKQVYIFVEQDAGFVLKSSDTGYQLRVIAIEKGTVVLEEEITKKQFTIG